MAVSKQASKQNAMNDCILYDLELEKVGNEIPLFVFELVVVVVVVLLRMHHFQQSDD